MKKRILALVLVVCMVLPILPLTALATTQVDGNYYDSTYARDVVFGNVPTTSWYSGQAGELYTTNGFGLNTKYAEYMEAFDEMVGFGDLVVDAGTVQSNGYDAEDWYNDVPDEVAEAMNVANGDFGSYINRVLLGKAHKSIDDLKSIDKNSSNFGVTTRKTQYMYAYEFDPTKEAGYTGPENLPKIIIMTGNQSDEKGAIFGTYYFLYDMLYNTESSPILEYLRHNVKLVVMPCLSPGGINQNTYWNANKVNINRNFEYNFTFIMDGGYNKDGTENPSGRYDKNGTDMLNTYTQCSGYSAFDQSEACAARDLMQKHSDAFYFTDFHTNTSGSLRVDTGLHSWNQINWHSFNILSDSYSAKLDNAATWHIDRLNKNFYEDYGLAEYGVEEGQALGVTSHNDGKGTSNVWAFRTLGVLSSTLEGISGWPRLEGMSDGILGGRYSPMTQKADSEILGNWLIAVLSEYAYDGDRPSEVFTTTFSQSSENWPTLSGLATVNGKYDNSGFAQLAAGKAELISDEYPLSYNGNWQVGYKLVNAAQPYNPDTYSFSATDPANFTAFDRAYLYSGSSKPIYLTDSTGANNGMYSGHGGMLVSGNNVQLINGWTNSKGGAVSDTTIRYTAEYAGYVAINVKDLIFTYNLSQILVMKNGVILGALQPGEKSSVTLYTEITDENGNRTGHKLVNGGTSVPESATFYTTVQAGDTIDFVCHANPEVVEVTAGADGNYAEKSGGTGNPLYETVRRGVHDFNFSVSYYENPNKDVAVYHSGKTADVLSTAWPTNILPFLSWSKTSGSLAGATATVNPALISAGYIKATDNWTQAVEGYKEYLRSLPKSIPSTGWIPTAYEAEGNPLKLGDVPSPMTRFYIFSINNIFSVNTSNGNYNVGFHVGSGEAFLVSENYYELKLQDFVSSATLISPTGTAGGATPLTISYDTDLADKLGSITNIHNANSGTSPHKPPISLVDYRSDYANYGSGAYKGLLLRPHQSSGTNGIGGMSYTVPRGVDRGNATLTVPGMFIATGHNDTRTLQYSLLLNGKELIPATQTTGANLLSDLQAALADLGSFTVSGGDVIELRFHRISKAVFMAPEINLTIKHDRLTETWIGTSEAAKLDTSSYETLFKWYKVGTDGVAGTSDDVLVSNGGTLEDSSYAVINPNFMGSGKLLTGNETYGEAILKYKDYLRTKGTLQSNSGWQPGGLGTAGAPYSNSGSDFLPITNLSYLGQMNIYGLKAGSTWAYTGKYQNDGVAGEVYVTEQYFEDMLNIYCMDYTYAKLNGTWTKVTEGVELIDRSTKLSDFNTATLTYGTVKTEHAKLKTVNGVTATAGTQGGAVYGWIPNSGECPTTAMYTSNNEQKSTATAYINGVTLRPASSGAMAIGYTVPAGVAGTATVTLNTLYYGNNGGSTVYNNAFKWNLAVNGVTVIDWTTYTPVSTTADSGDALATINNLLAAEELKISEGDVITFGVYRSGGAIYVSPSISVNIERSKDSAISGTWSGEAGADRTKPGTYQTFFVWQKTAGTNVGNGAGITGAKAVVNPWLIENGYVKTTDTYKEALQGYKNYLRTVTVLPTEGNWQLSAMQASSDRPWATGTDTSPIMYGDFLGLNNIYAMRVYETTLANMATPPANHPYSYYYCYEYTRKDGTEVKPAYYCSTGLSFDVWVSADYFELQMKLYCDEIAYNKTTKTFQEVTDPVIPWDTPISSMDSFEESTWTYEALSTGVSSSYAISGEVPYAFNANGGNSGIVAATLASEQETNAAYKGMVVRPNQNYSAAWVYTVPADTRDGKIALTLNSMYFGDWGNASNLFDGAFKWYIMKNGVKVSAEFTSAEPATGVRTADATNERVIAINNELKNLDIEVKAGDEIAFCITRTSGSSIYLSPSLTATVTENPRPMQRVQFKNGDAVLDSLLAYAGESIADLIAEYRRMDSDFAKDGCYINGVWYNSTATLPNVPVGGAVVDEFHLTSYASMSIGSIYTVSIHLPVIENCSEFAGVEIHGVKYYGTYDNESKLFVVNVKEAYASSILDANFTYTPFYILEDDSEVRGNVPVSVRAENLLSAYMTGNYDAETKALATAALDYARAAKSYFNETGIHAETAARLAGWDAEISGATPSTQNTEGAKYSFYASTLQVKDTINFLLSIRVNDGSDVNALKGQGAVKVNGYDVTPSLEAVVSIGGTPTYMVVLSGVPEAEFAKQQTFTIGDATLKYSVQDYCIRTFEKANADDEKNIIRAVYAVGKAAEAYKAKEANA